MKSVTFFITTRSQLRQTEAPFEKIKAPSEKIKAPSEKIEAPFGKIEALFSVTEGHLMILQYPVGKPTIQNAHKDESTIIYSGLSFFLPAPLAPPAPGPGAGGARGAGCFPVSLLYARIRVRPSSETETSNLWPFCVNLPKSVEIFNLFSYLCPAIAYKRKEQYEFSKKMN